MFFKKKIEDTKLFIESNAGEKIEVLPRKSAKAKRITIKISRSKGVELVVPKWYSMKKAVEFLNERKDWVIKTNAKTAISKQTPLLPGSEIMILGAKHQIEHGGLGRGVTAINGSKLLVYGNEDYLKNKVMRFLKEFIKVKISEMVSEKAKILGVKYKRITVKDTTTRWGSCSSGGNLSFSWRLVFAPPEVLEYLVCHEVAHLVHMNHSKDFWAVVEKLQPNYKIAKYWLKQNGNSLHCYN